MLGYGVFSGPDGVRRTGARVPGGVLDLAAAAGPDLAPVLGGGSLDALLAAGPEVWAAVHDLARAADGPVVAEADVALHLPFTVADYVDFYASEHHARNVGAVLRPGTDPLPANWKHLPAGYHGRAGTVVVSGTPVVRPCGQRRTSGGEVVWGPTARLDLEAEVGVVVGVGSEQGTRVPLEDLERHVFGICLLNDWSAREVQAWEYVPLGPFLGKSFATSVSPWVVPLAELAAARVAPPARDVPLLPYLDDAAAPPWALDLALEVAINGTVVSRPPFAAMYWTIAQQLAHLTANGASLRTGDLYASGTVSGPERGQRGCLLELSWGGAEPVALDDGTTRTWLEDGDEVVVSATAPLADGTRGSLGQVRGRVLPATP